MDAPIPRRVLYRALADVCGGQARHFESIADRAGSPGRGPRVASDSKALGRESRARALRERSAVFSRWIGDRDRYLGPDIDAATVGLLIASAYGHAGALDCLRASRPGELDGLGLDDLITIVDRLAPARGV